MVYIYDCIQHNGDVSLESLKITSLGADFYGMIFVPGERAVEIWRDVRFAHISLRTVRDNAHSFTENAASGPKVCVVILPYSYRNEP